MTPWLELLNALIQSSENEIVEFKEAKTSFDTDEWGKYFSAISNEANLREQQYGWLIFGIRDRDHAVVGTQYRQRGKSLDEIKWEIARHTTNQISLINIHEVQFPVEGGTKRVLMFQIPAAVTGIPTGWKGHFYAREGESLAPLSTEKSDRIRNQFAKDWSKRLIPESDLHALDPNAIALARKMYKEKKRNLYTEGIDALSDEEFLSKLRLMKNGQVTNAAMLLLGNPEQDDLFDRPPTVMWRLYGSDGIQRAYEIYPIPFITVGDKVFQKIRNNIYRYLPNRNTLFPMETRQYEPELFYELIHNCIAHQDYSGGRRIYIDEFDNRITFTNPGHFIPEDVRNVLKPGYAPPFYRNQLLADTMCKLGMIDTASMGIPRIFNIQRNKYFPLPDYTLEPNQVHATVYGVVLDINYSQLVLEMPELTLPTLFLLDKIQKNQGDLLSQKEIDDLRKRKLIEGRKKSLFIASKVAEKVDAKEQYIKNRAFDDAYYKKLIFELIKKFGSANKREIRNLIWDKLPDSLNDEQKENKIRNLLTAMKRDNLIYQNSPNRQKGVWLIREDQQD